MGETREGRKEKKSKGRGEGRWEGRRKEKEKEEGWKVGFWNVAGVKGKGESFWREVREWDMVVMMETWVEEKNWEKMKDRLPKEYRWGKQVAKRKNRKGRPMGGMMIGVREEKEEMKMIRMEEKGEGVMAVEVEIKKERWKLIGVYVNGGIEEDRGAKRMVGGAERRQVDDSGRRLQCEDGRDRERKGRRGGGRGKKVKRQEGKWRREEASGRTREGRMGDFEWVYRRG